MAIETETWVVDHLNRCKEQADHSIEDICEAAPHPTRDLVACTLVLWDRKEERHRRQVALVNLPSGAHHLLDLPYRATAKPAWSPDGTRLALVAETGEGTAQAVILDADDLGSDPVASDLGGMVEVCAWSPDGTALALLAAMPGAELSDVYGSGVVGDADEEAWQPRSYPSTRAGRVLFHWEPTKLAHVVCDLNVWEVTWCGTDALIALTSRGTGEGDWYGAALTWIDLGTETVRTLHESTVQLCQPRSSLSGSRWSVLSGVASDRGLPAGRLMVASGDGEPTVLDTASVHVNAHQWLDDSSVLFAGLRGLETAVGISDVVSGKARVLWSGPQTSGEFQPEVSGVPGSAPVVVLEGHLDPPTLGVLDEGTFVPVLSTSTPGTSYRAATAGATTSLVWTSSDGVEIQGLLTVPEGEGPHALVVHVHGGPVHAWRNTWAGRDPHTSVLVARGYAVLRPNPRGSTGRGSAFVEPVQGDMGGMDAEDIVSGVRFLIEQGRVDPTRIGVTGISYGGFMSAWLPVGSDLFAAAVSRSPCTDWLLQHLTSNIAEFDRLFLDGELFDPTSQYTTRSPLTYQDRISTPMLLTAGALDLATPASQAQVLYTALAERDVPAALAIYPEEGHGVSKHAAIADQCARMLEWFERFMPA